MREVAVLFARADSVYKTMPGCDVWDIHRDARKWPGGCPAARLHRHRAQSRVRRNGASAHPRGLAFVRRGGSMSLAAARVAPEKTVSLTVLPMRLFSGAFGGKVMSEFWELYKRPEWQKKRLEIMELRGWACEKCASAEKTLNVHHKLYIKGRKPWEYDEHQLEVLCSDCHKDGHDAEGELKQMLSGFGPLERDALIASFIGVVVAFIDPDDKRERPWESSFSRTACEIDPEAFFLTNAAVRAALSTLGEEIAPITRDGKRR